MSHIAIYFTAYRLASGYSEDGEHGGPKGTTHTAIDDLESFLWVLLYSVLGKYAHVANYHQSKLHGQTPRSHKAGRWWVGVEPTRSHG